MYLGRTSAWPHTISAANAGDSNSEDNDDARTVVVWRRVRGGGVPQKDCSRIVLGSTVEMAVLPGLKVH